MKRVLVMSLILGLMAGTQFGCGAGTGSDGTASEVAVSMVSGALNNTEGSAVSLNEHVLHQKSTIDRLQDLLDFMNPIGIAWGAMWSCAGGTLMPAFDGPGNYAFTPLSCTITWRNGKSASSKWSSTFTMVYGDSCDSVHPLLDHQVAKCSLTRTTSSDGNTRTLTGPNGNYYSVTHNTNGADTGWDSTVNPAPSNDGVEVACGVNDCTSKTLLVNGSHLTGTIDGKKWWDHTVTGNVAVAHTDIGRVVSGTVTVQHNLARFTSITTFNDVGYGSAGCCFPTTGSTTTTFKNGADKEKTETLTFGATCGEATLTDSDGNESAFTLKHCI